MCRRRRDPNCPSVLHVTTVPESLGFLEGQLSYVRQNGFDVTVVSSPGRLLDAFVRAEDISGIGLPMERRIAPLADATALIRLLGVVWQLRPSIVHGHTPKGGLLAMLASWFLRVPVRIYQIHGLAYETATGRRRSLLKATEWLACRCANHVLAVSPSILEVAYADGVCSRSKGRVLRSGSINGVESVERFNPGNHKALGVRARGKLGISQSSLVVGFVGRIVRDKGIVELANAWRIILVSQPDAQLLVVGPIETQDPVPAEALEYLDSEESVHFTGWTDDPIEYYAAMDVLALPSHREGFGLAALEAAAMEIPVVGTQIAGIVDAVEDGETGKLVPAKDVNALSTALCAYLVDPKVRREHGEAGRARAMVEFSQPAMWEAVVNEYRFLIARR